MKKRPQIPLLCALLSLLAPAWSAADLSGTWKDGWDGSLIEMTQSGARVEAKVVKEVRPHDFSTGKGELKGNTLHFEFIGKSRIKRNAILSADGLTLAWANGFKWTLEKPAPTAAHAHHDDHHFSGFPEELILSKHPEGKLYDGVYTLQPKLMNNMPYYTMVNKSEPADSPYKVNYLFQQTYRGENIWALQPVQPVADRFLASAVNHANRPWEGRWDPAQIQVRPGATRIVIPDALEVTQFSDAHYVGVYYRQPTEFNGWPVYAKESRDEALSSPFRITYIYRQKFANRLRWVIQPYQPDERLWRAQGYSDAEVPWDAAWNPRRTKIVAVQQPEGPRHEHASRHLPAALQVTGHPEANYNGVYYRAEERLNDRPIYQMENPREAPNSTYRHNYVFRQVVNGRASWVMQAVKPDLRRNIARTSTQSPVPWGNWNVRGLEVQRLDQLPEITRPPAPIPPHAHAGPKARTLPLTPERWMTRTNNRYLEGPVRIGVASNNQTDGWNYPQRGVEIDGQHASSASGNNTFAVTFKLPEKMSRLVRLDLEISGKGNATVGYGLRPMREEASADLKLAGRTRIQLGSNDLNLQKRSVMQLEVFVRGPGVEVDGLELTATYEE